MDFLDFDGEDLYFDEPVMKETARCIELSAESYGEDKAEQLLLRAYFLEPEHPVVLVALYRYFYYQHRLQDALLVAGRALDVFSCRLGLPTDWKQLTGQHMKEAGTKSMTMLRFYMLALKGSGYLQLRLGQYEEAMERLQKVSEQDPEDRLGASALLQVVQQEIGKTVVLAS